MSYISLLLLITAIFYVLLNLKLLSTSQSVAFCFHFELFFTMPIRIEVGPSLIAFIIILHYYPLTIAYNCNYTNHTHSIQHNILYSTLNSLNVGTYNRQTDRQTDRQNIY